ncbi:MAG: hypothetical protein JSW00_04000 [Thermoplasmata archaeon]|nr:MAG: hypothetical protein JSW00_04000 [Thermoplasmata archaeon]
MMKCEKCKGTGNIMMMGWQKKRCPKCHGVGVVTVMKQKTNDDMEVNETTVVVKKKRGRPKKEG